MPKRVLVTLILLKNAKIYQTCFKEGSATAKHVDRVLSKIHAGYEKKIM
jgi:hypothetical protein